MNIIVRALFSVICLGLVSAKATPLNYTIAFSPNALSGIYNPNILPTIGAFTYDASLSSDPFSDFTVTWNGETFDMTATANAPQVSGSPACINGATGGAAAFLLLTNCSDAGWWAGKNSGGTVYDFAFYEPGSGGSWSVAWGPASLPNGTYYGESRGAFGVQETPEPSPAAFILLGCGVLLCIRRVAVKGPHPY